MIEVGSLGRFVHLCLAPLCSFQLSASYCTPSRQPIPSSHPCNPSHHSILPILQSKPIAVGKLSTPQPCLCGVTILDFVQWLSLDASCALLSPVASIPLTRTNFPPLSYELLVLGCSMLLAAALVPRHRLSELLSTVCLRLA